MVELVMIEIVITDDGNESEGERTVIATIDDAGKVSGTMARQIRGLAGTVGRYGATGEAFTIRLTEPWTVAYALSTNNAVFMDAGLAKVGPVVAVSNGRELKVPARFRVDDDVEGVVF